MRRDLLVIGMQAVGVVVWAFWGNPESVSGMHPTCHSACNIAPPYCLTCRCYPDGGIADDDLMSIDRPRQVTFPSCSMRGAVGGSGPT